MYITNSMKQHCMGIMHIAKTPASHDFKTKNRLVQCDPTLGSVYVFVHFSQKLNQPPVFYYQRDKFSVYVLRRNVSRNL